MKKVCIVAEPNINNMTLDEAIKHAEFKATTLDCNECRKEHKQLAEWLKELKKYKEKEMPKEVDEQGVNHGISASGEYDIDYDMLCPSCNAVVGNRHETGELWYEYCPDCGQKLKYTPKSEAEQ